MEERKAIVQKVFSEGKHGPYLVAIAENIEGSITLSLEPTAWQESDWPEEGEIIHLSDLRSKRAGWRAKKGRYWRPSDEQTVNSKEQNMSKELKKVISRLRDKWLPEEEDRVWRQWVDLKKSRVTSDLLDLLSLKVRDSFKRRALFLLMAPSADFNPVYWERKIGCLCSETKFLGLLSPGLLVYAAELVIEFCSVLRPVGNDRSGIITCGGYIKISKKVLDEHSGTLEFYNNCMQALLKLLPSYWAEKVFLLFPLKDFSCYSSIDEGSGYNPFGRLMGDKEINEKWKKAADTRMRMVIEDEVAGLTRPRADWEEALGCYSNIIQLQLFSELHYSRELFVDQMLFLTFDRYRGKHLIKGYNVARIFAILSGEDCKDLRHRIARFVILFDNSLGKFFIYSDTIKAAEQMLAEFGESDPELKNRLQILFEESESRKSEKNDFNHKAKEAEENVLSLMM
jgi:hypothetical protein